MGIKKEIKMVNLPLAGLYYYPCQRRFNYWKWLAIIGWLLFFLMLGLYLFPDLEAASEVTYTDSEIANAIYKAENSVKYPYGIKSINTYGNKEYARKICLNTIRNQRIRHAKHNCRKDFLSCLWHRYCPPTAHKLNKFWLVNVKFFLTKGK